ncbi:K(+)-transporting ATPase subunit F [Silvimonas iriomotensis]|nr:K(+)-transporting ATPase subunit F [Silvimonas iriomotensis]
MNWLYLMAAAVFVLLLVYLVYALFNAEDVA